MKTDVYFCNCGGNISSSIDSGHIRERLKKLYGRSLYFGVIDFACSEDGKKHLEMDIKRRRPDRIVIAACSPRNHGETFTKVICGAGINPYLMQLVNIREHAAWVCIDNDSTTRKAFSLIQGGIERAALQKPLEKIEAAVNASVLIVGAGPAGIKAALTLSKAGRKVVLIEKSPAIGGLPVRFEELFPDGECAPCLLQPMIDELLHEHSENIELMTLTEVAGSAGYFGNFVIDLKQSPRHVDMNRCVGCGECVSACPVKLKSGFDCGLSEKKAIDFPFAGAQPNVPFIDRTACLRFRGEKCSLCKSVCPVKNAIVYNDPQCNIEREAGAIILAIGSSLYDCSSFANLGYGKAGVYTSLEFERILASNGPTGGKLRFKRKKPSVAIIHCVGSLDKRHREYCSSICCRYAFKFNRLIRKKYPGTKITHFHKELCLPGRDGLSLYRHIKEDPDTRFVRYEVIDDLNVKERGGSNVLEYKGDGTRKENFGADMIVLCPALVPSSDATALSEMFGLTQEPSGFFARHHHVAEAAGSPIRGIYVAGACRSFSDVRESVTEASAASGAILSELTEGGKLVMEPITASVDNIRCGGCKVCLSCCPRSAIVWNEKEGTAAIKTLLCDGCGTCAAACPAGAITAGHFTDEALAGEIGGLLCDENEEG